MFLIDRIRYHRSVRVLTPSIKYVVFVTIGEIVFGFVCANLEQRCTIKFCVKFGKSATVAFEKLEEAYRKLCLSRSQVFSWHKSFLEDRKHFEDEDEDLRRHSTTKTDENIECVNDLARSDRRLVLRMLIEQLNLNTFTVYQILTDHLQMR